MALLRTVGPSRRTVKVAGPYEAACRHLSAVDPVLRTLIDRIGPCTLSARREYFATLCDSIISQQLSVSVAAVLYQRFAAQYPHRRPTPSSVAATPLPRLRGLGLSRQKARYIRDLAASFKDGRIIPRRFVLLSNADLIASLVSIHGIGRWTAEMFLIFSLNRLDVLPVDDLGIRKAVRRCYGLRALPTPVTLRRLARPWHPYETVACWYLWQSLRLPSYREATQGLLRDSRQDRITGGSARQVSRSRA